MWWLDDKQNGIFQQRQTSREELVCQNRIIKTRVMHLGASGKAVRVQSWEPSLHYEIIQPTVCIGLSVRGCQRAVEWHAFCITGDALKLNTEVPSIQTLTFDFWVHKSSRDRALFPLFLHIFLFGTTVSVWVCISVFLVLWMTHLESENKLDKHQEDWKWSWSVSEIFVGFLLEGATYTYETLWHNYWT